MKHIFIYISIMILAIICVALIKLNREVVPAKVYTVDTYYSYVIDRDDTIDFFFYLNKTHVLKDIEAYDFVQIEDEKKSKSLSLDVHALKYINDEVYLGETYQKYVLMLDMPILNASFEIDDMYASIYLTNGEYYRFHMGSISLYHANKEEMEHLDWESLSAVKKEGYTLSRIYEIYVAFISLNQMVSHIEIGINQNVGYNIDDHKLTIHINDDQQLLYATPIIIYFVDDTIQIIDYFVYINDYQILKESGHLLNGYELS